MALLPGFEYDIFISYRHNDNLDGCVSGFVEALERELKATLKEPLSIYFDKNPHDGLLETHDVYKSLEGKLKALVFIPVLSQIYCDPNSFAWQHEFCAFNKSAPGHFISSGVEGRGPEEGFGREIKLRSGNVASRILPIVIHHLDQEDLAMIEAETGSKLRFIDFTFLAAGVNRPLRKEDKREDNVNRLSTTTRSTSWPMPSKKY
jgi:hypothetical protein